MTYIQFQFIILASRQETGFIHHGCFSCFIWNWDHPTNGLLCLLFYVVLVLVLYLLNLILQLSIYLIYIDFKFQGQIGVASSSGADSSNNKDIFAVMKVTTNNSLISLYYYHVSSICMCLCSIPFCLFCFDWL